jgi:uncharacterized membrane protein
MRDLGTEDFSAACAINEHNQIVGYDWRASSDVNGETHAVLWTLRSG